MAETNVAAGVETHRLQAWREHAEDRPLRLLICGQGGAGKSTLINHLLKLKGKDCAEEGMGGKSKTSFVSMYEGTTERGIKLSIFDTPGFDDANFRDERFVAMMLQETKAKTKSELDLVIFCVSLGCPSPRLQRADVNAMKIITQAFTSEIWNKAVVVLTCANIFAEKLTQTANKYKEVVETIKKSIVDELQNIRVSHKISSQLPIVTAGYTDPILKYEEQDGAWDDRLFLKALEKVDPAIAPALLQCRWSWEDLKTAVVDEISGVVTAVCAGGGGVAGGAGYGAIVGGPLGAAVGGLAGLTLGSATTGLVTQREKIATILQIQYQKLKLK